MPGRGDPSDTDSGQEKWLELNASLSATGPIDAQEETPPDADEHKGEEGNRQIFTPDPGTAMARRRLRSA